MCPALKEWAYCNQICLNNGTFATIHTGNTTGHGCLCCGIYSGSCCEIKSAIFMPTQINVYYKTLSVHWNFHHPHYGFHGDQAQDPNEDGKPKEEEMIILNENDRQEDMKTNQNHDEEQQLMEEAIRNEEQQLMEELAKNEDKDD
uniref:Uncharacterized protein n=1 Tax=Ciona savignyi TaxID=51511 RepID=H2Z1B8_CIOSA